jgi:hypothetical protein
MPPDAAVEIADLAAIINRLWGTPAGTPLARAVMVVAWHDKGVTWGPADRVQHRAA